MKVAVTGSTGLVGSALVELLERGEDPTAWLAALRAS